MSDVKVFEFAPEQATDNTTAGTATDGSTVDGIQKVLDAYTSDKAVEGVTSYMIGGNLYVVVVTT
tara:strand:- start:595 stop:789 length:195 start_codon:yes stop_codon:yes gene_type:complete